MKLSTRDRTGRTATQRMEAARRNRGKIIHERTLLLSCLSKCWKGSHLTEPEHEQGPSSAWRYILCLHSPAGQLAWHLTDDEAETYFSHLAVTGSDWDGHTHTAKLARLEALAIREDLNGLDS